jgi:hypothetical protein
MHDFKVNRHMKSIVVSIEYLFSTVCFRLEQCASYGVSWRCSMSAWFDDGLCHISSTTMARLSMNNKVTHANRVHCFRRFIFILFFFVVVLLVIVSRRNGLLTSFFVSTCQNNHVENGRTRMMPTDDSRCIQAHARNLD